MLLQKLSEEVVRLLVLLLVVLLLLAQHLGARVHAPRVAVALALLVVFAGAEATS